MSKHFQISSIRVDQMCFAINFNITGPFNPTLIQGLRVQYGSGLGTATGLPDFNHTADLTHSAQYSRVVNVPAYGTNNWAVVPEPATWALMIGGFGLAGVALRRRTVRIA